MAKYILKRLAGMLPLLIAVSILAFGLVRVMPGDPATAYLNSINAPVTEEALAAVRQELGLDDSLPVQYGKWFGRVLRLDLGVSYMSKRPVVQDLMTGFRYTLLLTGVSLLWVIAVSVPLGVLSARRPGGRADSVIRAVIFLGSSFPKFWLGFLLVELFALKLGILPVQGAAGWKHIILPSFTMACSHIATYTKLLRNSLLENKGRRYVTYARARGVSERRILFAHILPNSLVPVLTSLALNLGGMLSGAVIVENVFSWPGLGRTIVASVAGRDYPMVQGYILLMAVVFVVCNLFADLGCAFLNPRLQLEVEE